MPLKLYMHPLASFCHKVMIALEERQIAYDAETVDLMNEGGAAAHVARWPVGKIPVLWDSDAGRLVPETSLIIEYLDRYPGSGARMIPADMESGFETRLWDRFFDLYVSIPMQKIVIDRIRPEGSQDPYGVEEARGQLRVAYQMIEAQLSGREWATGDDFTMADCSAAPALFFASVVEPLSADLLNVSAYLERQLARPSVRQVYRQAAPYFSMFPYRDAMPERYLKL